MYFSFNLISTADALTFVIYSINNLYSVPYEHIVIFRFDNHCCPFNFLHIPMNLLYYKPLHKQCIETNMFFYVYFF